MTNDLIVQEIINIIKEKNNIVICAHTQPDGDAIGSCIGLAYAIVALKKQCVIFNESPYPDWLNFLNKPVNYINSLTELDFKPELIIALDCGTSERLGIEIQNNLKNILSINIDHHLDNPHYADYNWTDSGMAACGLMVAELIANLDIPFENDMATALYVALCTDTGNFTYDNTDLLALEWLLKLAKTPISIPRIQEKLNDNVSINKLKFWAKLFQEIIVTDEGRLAYVTVPQKYYQEYNTDKEDLEGFIEKIRQIENVRVAMLIREDAKSGVKISLRSRNDDDVRAILVPLGGGGHKNAAGASLKMTIDMAIEKILPSIHKMW